MYVANEGKMIFVVPPVAAEAVLAVLRAHPLGRNAAAIGTVEEEPAGIVLAEGPAGGARMVDMLTGDPLPRIC
jgi:hydrogenase expression/formation protein HypE